MTKLELSRVAMRLFSLMIPSEVLFRATICALIIVCHPLPGYSFEIGDVDLQPGTVVDVNNISEYENFLHPAFVAEIAKGEFQITLGEEFSFEIHPLFASATEKYAGTARLGDNPGELFDYIAGVPFPDRPGVDDPRAGEKMAWNLRYAYGGDSGEIPEMYWYYRDMKRNKLERTLEFSAERYNFKHRVIMEPVPEVPKNRDGLYSAIFLEAHEPPDVSGTSLLLFYNEDDRKVEQGWMYVPLLRRVRRIATKQKTDSFLGSDIMIEDFLGYSGRIMDMEWEFKGEAYKLLPMYKHRDVKTSGREARGYDYKFIDFSPPNYCMPAVHWQLRRVYVIEGRPKRRDHPLSKREFYVDAETYVAPFVVLYDRAGVVWKLGMGGISHPDYHLSVNKGSMVPIIDSSSMVDLQTRHCTAIQMITIVNSKRVRRFDFQPSKLDERGR